MSPLVVLAVLALGQTPVIPANCRVALLPFAQRAAIEDQSFREKVRAVGDAELAKQFAGRGFALVSPEELAAGMRAANWQVDDREKWNSKSLLALGAAFPKADWVVLCVLSEANSERSNGVFSIGGGATGQAFVKTWVVDLAHQTVLQKGTAVEGRSSSGALGDLTGARGRIPRAVELAIEKSLKDFLKPFPVTKG